MLFPFVILLAFYRLVTNHHHKLYGPADYRSDEGFLAAYQPLSNLGRKLHSEVEAAATLEVGPPGTQEAVGDAQRPDRSADGQSKKSSDWNPRSRGDLVASAYVAEGLVFQELQNELGGAVIRNISVTLANGDTAEIDGIIHVGLRRIVVDVKFMGANPNQGRLTQVSETLKSQFRRLSEHLPHSKMIAAFVLSGSDTTSEQKVALAEGLGSSLKDVAEVRVFGYQDLLSKYGFPVGQRAS